MKKILIVHTGGTIGSTPENDQREVNVAVAKKILFDRFALSESPYASLADSLFEDEKFAYETLSENMTLFKWNKLLSHLSAFDLSSYRGVIILHGTDTLPYTASLLSLCLASASVPVMLVAGDKPPSDESSNANANFAAAVSLIMEGIAPHVYVPYRNADGSMLLHLGATLMQCAPFSADFYSADKKKTFLLTQENRTAILAACAQLSAQRSKKALWPAKELVGSVLPIYPYVGLDYDRITADGYFAAVHATYHSGTVCVDSSQKPSCSFLDFAKRLKKKGTHLFIAPCIYDGDKYSSTARAVEEGEAVPLSMTWEAAYVKLTLAEALGYAGDDLIDFMRENLVGEIVE